MPANIATTPRTALIMASELAGNAEALLAQALVDAGTSDAEGIDALVAQALSDMNLAINQVRAFKRMRAEGQDIEGQPIRQVRSQADLLALYDVTTPEGFNRRLAQESDYEVRVVPLDNGVRVDALVPATDRVVSRELLFPFTRVRWGEALTYVQAAATAALEEQVAGAADEATDPMQMADETGADEAPGDPVE